MSSLLIQEPPLQVLPTLAAAVGLNESVFLQQLHYWLERSKHEHDGKRWIYNTYAGWAEQFPFWSEKTIRRIVEALRNRNLIITTTEYNQRSFDRTLWYAIDYAEVDGLLSTSAQTGISSAQTGSACGQLDQTIRSSCPDDVDNLTTPIPETISETTTETTATEGEAAAPPAPSPAPAKAHVLRLDAKRRLKRLESPHLDPTHFDRNGFIPPGAGRTAVEVYYERHDFGDEQDHLSAAKEDDLVRNCPDLDRLRDVIAVCDRRNYRKGNIDVILDLYRKGTQHGTHRQNGAGYTAPVAPNSGPNGYEDDIPFDEAAVRRAMAETQRRITQRIAAASGLPT